ETAFAVGMARFEAVGFVAVEDDGAFLRVAPADDAGVFVVRPVAVGAGLAVAVGTFRFGIPSARGARRRVEKARDRTVVAHGDTLGVAIQRPVAIPNHFHSARTTFYTVARQPTTVSHR